MTLRVSEICKCGQYFSEFESKDQIRENVTKYLLQLKLPASIKGLSRDTNREEFTNDRKRGVCKLKKTNILDGAVRNKDNEGKDRTFFGVPLPELVMKNVTSRTGHVMLVPQGLHDMCVYVLAHAEVKGIFRKQGSGAKQESIKNQIETCGTLVTEDADVNDVSVVIKYFLRMLPIPLIPDAHQELFLACGDHPDREDVLLLACLLLPVSHLNVLTYLMQFLEQVASHSAKNQMNAYNIAVCVGPNIMPVYKQQLVMKVVAVIQILIEKSDLIGIVPEAMRRIPPPPRKRTICQKIIGRFLFK